MTIDEFRKEVIEACAEWLEDHSGNEGDATFDEINQLVVEIDSPDETIWYPALAWSVHTEHYMEGELLLHHYGSIDWMLINEIAENGLQVLQ